MTDIKQVDKCLIRSALNKVDGFFILNLKLLVSRSSVPAIDNLGDELKFKCSSSPPRKICVKSEDIIVSIPNGIYNLVQLRKLAQIIEQLSKLDEFKYFKFYEFFDNIEYSDKYREYFFLETSEKHYSNTCRNDLKLLDELYGKNIPEIELNELLKPLIHGTIKKKIVAMHELLEHFTKNTNILIEQTMNKLDEKSLSINSNLKIIQNRILFQEAKINRLNDFAWKILEQMGVEQSGLDFSENETIIDGGNNAYVNNIETKEVLTLKEAMEIRKSHGGFGLPEDFESHDKLLQLDNKASYQQIGVINKPNDIQNDDLIGTNDLPKTNLSKHFFLNRIELDEMHTIHPAITQLMKIKAGLSLENMKNLDETHKDNHCKKIYDPISEYKNKNLCIRKNKTLKNFTPTVFSYLGRPIPPLSHQEIRSVPRKKIIETIQNSMNTEVSKNEQWKIMGRPLEKREIKEKIPKILEVKPAKYEMGAFNYSGNDIYNILI